MGNMQVSTKRLRELELAEMKLQALESGGVDNWEFYGDALEQYHADLEKDERIEDLVAEILQILGENAYEPSERGAGIAFHLGGEEEVLKLLKESIKELNEDS